MPADGAKNAPRLMPIPLGVTHMRIRSTLAVILVLTIVTGCPVPFYGVFNSSLAEEITLETRSLTSSGRFEYPTRHKLVPGKKKRVSTRLAEVTAIDLSGQLLFQ